MLSININDPEKSNFNFYSLMGNYKKKNQIYIHKLHVNLPYFLYDAPPLWYPKQKIYFVII